jgi:hypothetical protein
MAVIILSGLIGCIGFTTNWEPSWTDGFSHEKGHLKAFWQDMSGIHRFIDKYLLNYDENDPTRY